MTEAEEKLSEILDRLGPGLWLHVDGRALIGTFGLDGAVEAAQAFAKARQCCFIPNEGALDSGEIIGKFGRAYIKRAIG